MNRGAINVSSATPGGNSLFTISNNVFIDVWRRCPRVALGNQALIFNNLLYRWGFGNQDQPEKHGANEWVAMVADNSGSAAIYANRFIPWEPKTIANKTINIDATSTVDVSSFPNRFDGPLATPPSPAGLPSEGTT